MSEAATTSFAPPLRNKFIRPMPSWYLELPNTRDGLRRFIAPGLTTHLICSCAEWRPSSLLREGLRLIPVTASAESAQRVAVILRANHLHNCIAVSDAYHMFRIRKLLQHERVPLYLAPRPDSLPHSAWQRGEAVLREAFSYLLWKVD